MHGIDIFATHVVAAWRQSSGLCAAEAGSWVQTLITSNLVQACLPARRRLALLCAVINPVLRIANIS
jgi:hypothetical protein